MIRDLTVTLLDGTQTRFGNLAPGAALVVNVASKCGFAPQYAGLERLHQEYREMGLAVIGMPCNQFLAQEPGSADQIQEFCQVNYGVTFPLLAKGKVNGRKAEPLFQELKRGADPRGVAGPVAWNFEKFVVSAGENPAIARFRSTTEPEDAAIRAAIDRALDIRS